MKNKKKFFFWLTVYILWYLFFCYGVHIPDDFRILGRDYIILRSGKILRLEIIGEATAIMGMLFIEVFMLEQTKLEGDRRNKWGLAIWAFSLFMVCLSFVIKPLIQGVEVGPSLFAVGFCFFVAVAIIIIVCALYKVIDKKKTICASIILLISIIAYALFVKKVESIETQKDCALKDRVYEQVDAAVEGDIAPTGNGKESCNYADMINKLKEDFPNETIYYSVSTNGLYDGVEDGEDRWISITYTTKQETRVYFDNYILVKGELGDRDAVYKFDYTMVSQMTKHEDFMKEYTGIIEP